MDSSEPALRGDDSGPSNHLDNSEEVTSNVSEFAQVIFNNVQECYAPGNDLQCNYTLTPAIKPHSRDWIGVFKVGWTSTRQYRAFEWAPCPSKWTEGLEWTQDITFKAYYLPKDEDAEYYQLCYIDSAGKMRGASTPFQFLEQSADDFVQIIDDSMDILMIHNKTEYCVEELKKAQEDKREIEEECNALKEKVVVLEKELANAKGHLEELNKEYEKRSYASQTMEEELRCMREQLAEAHNKVGQLSEEAGNYERSLQQTEGAFMEVVNRELGLRNKLDELEKKYEQIASDKESLKVRAESAEHNNSEMCEEIDQLKELLSHSNQTHQEVRESEVRMKEQYQRIQQELHLSSSNTEQLQVMESQLSSVESSKSLLTRELDSLKMVQDKLSRDLVAAKTEKESTRVAMERQSKAFREEKRKMQLLSHQNREKTALLQEQISALKDGIQQLAQEKEMVSKGTKGSLEAQHIATKDLKDKMRRAQFQCREEVRRRGELQKKIVSMETSFREEKGELQRDVEDLRVRLQMAAEEYKKVYTECRQLQARLEKKKASKETTIQAQTEHQAQVQAQAEAQVQALAQSIVPSVMTASASWKDNIKDIGSINKVEEEKINLSMTSQTSCRSSQAIQASAPQHSQASQSVISHGTAEEKATQSSCPQVEECGRPQVRARSRDDTFDLREMHDQMCELARELDERKKESDRYRKLHQDEKEKLAHLERVWQLKYQSIESKNSELHDKYNKMLNDYTNMKHSYESLKFDMETPNEVTPVQTPPQHTPTHFGNPYVSSAVQQPDSSELKSRFGNPYARSSEEHERLPAGLMEVSVDSLNLESIRYPPETVEDAILSDASDSIPPALLPEPMQPDVLPAGKIAAIKMVSSKVDGRKDGQEHTDDEREDAQFVDAQEFPEESSSPKASAPPLSVSMPTDTPPDTPPTTPTAATAPSDQQQQLPPPSPWGSEAKKCPECVIEFPPTYPEEEFVKHVQRHFAKLCPVCQGLLDPQITQVDFQRHVEQCLTNNQ